MVGIYFKRHRHQVGTELADGPDDGEALQFSSRVRLLSLVKGARGTTNDALLVFLYLSEDSSEASGWGIGVQPEGEVKVWEGSDWAGGEEGFEAVEGLLTLRTPVEDCIFPGEGVEGPAMAAKFLTYRR